jgi:hypothetical protein
MAPRMTVYENIYPGREEIGNKTIGLAGTDPMRGESEKTLAARMLRQAARAREAAA